MCQHTAEPPGTRHLLGRHSQVTLSPVFILLLEENSFRDRVTSLGTGEHSVSWEGTLSSRVGGNAHVPPSQQTIRRDTYWDTSAMCLWRKVTHRSSSSSRRTSLIRASPMPLVSYLGRGQECHSGDGAGGHTVPSLRGLYGSWGDMGGHSS